MQMMVFLAVGLQTGKCKGKDMIVTSAKKYSFTDDMGGTVERIIAVINGNEMHVPLKTSNRHYRAILKWVNDGNSIGSHSFD